MTKKERKKKKRVLSPLSPRMCTHRGKACKNPEDDLHSEKMAVQKPGRELPPGTELAAAPNPGPLTSRTVRNTVLLLEPPVCAPLLWQLELTKTAQQIYRVGLLLLFHPSH